MPLDLSDFPCTNDLFSVISRQILDGNYTHIEILISRLTLHKHVPSPLLEDIIKKNMALARQRIEDNRCPNSMVFMGMVLQTLNRSENAYSEAINFYEQAMALGNSSAMNSRAYMHEHGLGGAVNYVEAILLYERASKLGNTGAKNKLQGVLKKLTLDENKKLLDIVWRDMLTGISCTNETLEHLKTNCGDDINNKLKKGEPNERNYNMEGFRLLKECGFRPPVVSLLQQTLFFVINTNDRGTTREECNQNLPEDIKDRITPFKA